MSSRRWISPTSSTRNAAFTPDKAALRFEGRTLTYAAFERAHRAGRARVEIAAGRRPWRPRGDPGANHPDYLVLLYACARLGALLVPLNWRLAVPEQVFILCDASVKVLVVEQDFAGRRAGAQRGAARHPHRRPRLCAPAPRRRSTICWPRAPGDGRNPHIDETCPLLMVYTSGTTGRPKGAVLRQEALMWNAVMSQHMHDMTAEDHILTVLPMFHVGGLNIQTTPALQYRRDRHAACPFRARCDACRRSRGPADADRAGAGDDPGLIAASALGPRPTSQLARADDRLDAGAGAADRSDGGARRAGAAGLWLDRNLSGRGLQPVRRRSLAQGFDRVAGPVVRGPRRRR